MLAPVVSTDGVAQKCSSSLRRWNSIHACVPQLWQSPFWRLMSTNPVTWETATGARSRRLTVYRRMLCAWREGTPARGEWSAPQQCDWVHKGGAPRDFDTKVVGAAIEAGVGVCCAQPNRRCRDGP